MIAWRRRLGFGHWLAIIVVGGLVARIAYVAAIGTGLTLGFDAQWYGLEGGLLESGLGYIDPAAFYERFLGEPTATFPPLWPILVAGANRLGLTTTTQLQVVGALLGSLTVLSGGSARASHRRPPHRARHGRARGHSPC